jgi:hypothetical protein
MLIKSNFTLNCGETNHDSEKPQTPTNRSCITGYKSMPAKDIFHSAVRKGLEQEGWIITNDPLRTAIISCYLLGDRGSGFIFILIFSSGQ